MHVNTPQIAGGFGGVWGELPLLPLLVAAELMDGSPQPLGSDQLLIDELLHRFQMAHDGVPRMHPAWECRREEEGLEHTLLSLPRLPEPRKAQKGHPH